MTILIIEDNDDLAFGLSVNFVHEGFEVISANDGEEGKRTFVSAAPDVVLLDLRLPHISGFDVLRYIRSHDEFVPIIIVSAAVEEVNKVLALRLGADDYVTKPFSLLELIERVKARLRKRGAPSARRLEFPPMNLNIAARTLSISSVDVHLTPKEFDLLEALARSAGSVQSQSQLLSEVWGYKNGTSIRTRTVDQHVRQLKRKLRAHGCDHFVARVAKKGYVFNYP